MGLSTIQLFEPCGSNMPGPARLDYENLIDNKECENGHAFWFHIEEHSSYPLLTEYLVSIGVVEKCLIHVNW